MLHLNVEMTNVIFVCEKKRREKTVICFKSAGLKSIVQCKQYESCHSLSSVKSQSHFFSSGEKDVGARGVTTQINYANVKKSPQIHKHN